MLNNLILRCILMGSVLGFSAMPTFSIEKNDYSFVVEQEITKEFENKLKGSVQKKPVLILVGGLQGSGKSSLINRIKQLYDINVISTDSIRHSLFDRGLKVSPKFSKYVSNIYINLVKKSLASNSNIIIDANSHSERIAEMGRLLKENNSSNYSVIKIFLSSSESNLRNRVKNRKPTVGCYQGTLSDLEAALLSTKVNLNDYDLVVDTDNINESNVFEMVNDFISPYFKLQNPPPNIN